MNLTSLTNEELIRHAMNKEGDTLLEEVVKRFAYALDLMAFAGSVLEGEVNIYEGEDEDDEERQGDLLNLLDAAVGGNA
jgi:hypothetical protein